MRSKEGKDDDSHREKASCLSLDLLSVTCEDVCALRENTVQLRCSYSEINITTVFWFSRKQNKNWRKKDEPEDLTLDSDYSGRVKQEATNHHSTLTISDLRERDSGEYQLMFMKDGVKRLSSDAVNLTVTGISKDRCWDVTYTSRRVCALMGSTVDISCTYSHPSDYTVNKTFWHYNRPGDFKDLREKRQFAGRVEYVGNTLRIKELKMNDSGEYRLRIITDTTKGTYSGTPGVILTVTDTMVTSSPNIISERQEVILICSTKCTLNNKHTYIWYKNGQQVTNGFTKDNKLYLDSVSDEELQEYSCAVGGFVTLDLFPVTCSQESICAVKASQVTLKCFYSYINIKTVFWFSQKQSPNWRKNSEPEDLTLDSDYSGRVKPFIGSYRSELMISDLRERDSGEYQLMIIMKDGVKHYSSVAVNLTVTDLQVRMNPTTTDLRDETVKLTCDSSCTSGYYYYWIKDGQYFTSTVSRNMHVLLNRDAGSYSCTLDQTHLSSSLCISKDRCWDVTYTSRRVCALMGSTVDISCTCSHPSGYTVKKTFWHYGTPGDFKDLREKHQFAGRVEYVGNTLRIKELKMNDSGEYRFRIITDTTGGQYSGSPGVILTVTETMVTSSPNIISEGQEVILSCSTKCTLNNKHTYIWYKNGRQVTDGFTKDNKLYLDSISDEELQEYSCAVGVPILAGTGTYVYKYEALLFSGLYQEGLARAGIKINSKVLISAAAENAFFLKLSKPQLFEYSGIWPTDTFVTSKLTSELSAQLQIPIKFEYTNGKVGRIFTPSVVPTTVINLHRGILNILQLNLKKTQNIYEVQEDGVQGICETQYLISEDEENNHTIITKSRDLTLCQERIMKDVGLTYIEKCIECQQIVDALNHLATKKLEEVHEDVPLKYIQLIQLMRFASVDAVEGIWSQFKTRPNFRKWILDAVPAVGTLAALKFIKKIVLADELSIPEFTQVLLAAVHMVTANLDTIKMYSGLALCHKVQETPVLRDVALLGYGTMINRYCSVALECPVELLKPIHEIVTEVTAETDIAEITLILKVLGNAGHPASIKYITKFLPLFGNQIPNFPLRVQVGAILALKAVAKKEPKLVQNVVLQIFVNKDLHPELRMVSWIVLFETKPGMALVITLARALRKEPNLQVASLVYSHMKALTRSTSPEFAPIAAACNVAIRILSPKLEKLSFLYSKAIFLDGYEPRLMVGAVGSAFIINDVATVLPRAVVAKARAYLAGAATDVIEVGIRTDGIQEALLKSPFLKDEVQPRMKQVLKALKAFKALPKKQPLGSIYVKLLGQEIAFANVGKAVLEQATQLTTGGYIPELAWKALKAMQNGIAFKYAKPLLVAEVRRIFPSVAGVPMEFSLYTAGVAAANLKADGPAVEGLELEVQLGPRAAKKLLKEINIVDAKIPKFKTVLQKLKEILEGGQRNNNSRFFNHNVLFPHRSTSSRSISSSSSVRSSNSHLSKAKIAWGAECQQYAISINAGAGNHGPSPMAYLKVKCEKVSTIITTYAKSLAEYIPGVAQMTGLAISNEKNIERQIELVILVPTERTLDIIIKTPTMTLSKSNLVLPIALTFEAVQAYPEQDVMNIIRNIYIEASSGTIRIKQKGQGIALYAPSHGLQEVYYDTEQWKIYVADWMKGQTCGLCGKADGEIIQNYHTPSGYLTKSSVSFVHSWVLPAESCHDADPSQQINLVPEFALDKTYVYKYEALLLGGLPQEGLARAGIKVSSKVHLSAVTENTFLMKLMDPLLHEYAGIWPKDPFVPATKLTSALAAQLQIPIKFEYANGVVGKVFAPAGVSPTVLNLHRGILNILQLNLKKTQNIYELQEAGVQGVCKTQYVISEDPKANHFIVTKAKDLSHCQERIMKDVGLAYADRCAECTKRVKSLIETSTYNYIMKPAAAGALIAEARVEEVHQFSPFNEIHGAAQMEAKQTLAFEEIQKTPVVPIKAEYLARGSLQYEFATEILQTPIQLIKISYAPAQIVEVLKHLVVNNVAMVHDDAPLKFVQLVQLLRAATLENIEAIWAQFKDKPVYRHWLLDALPVVGTTVIVKLIKEKFLAGELTIPEFIQVLVVALQMVTADLDTIQLTASLAMHEKIDTIPALREVVMLGYGSMIAKYCVAVPTCPAELLRPIHEIAAEAISKNDIPEITLALKVLGNAGHPASLKPIMKLLPGLRTAATSLPLRVQPVALQLVLDRALHPEVRMVACIVLFEAKPSVALVSSLAGAMKMETNMQVASFAYSHIKSLTRITAPDMATVSSYDWLHAYMINDAATILPRAVVAKARAYLAGAAADVLEIGVRTEGIQEALLKSPAADESVDRITKIKRTLRALATGPKPRELLKGALKALQEGIAFQYAKPLLVAEVRRIFPTAVGVPMELSMYSAVVGAASVNVKATITPPLPEEIETMTLEQLKRTDVQLQAEARPSIAIQKFAAMGVNTALIQAAVMAKGEIRLIAPGKVAARADILKGNYKVEALPVELPEHIAAVSFETLAVVRNIEDPTAERIVPLVPELSLQNPQTWSSEIPDPDMRAEAPMRAAAPFHKTLCLAVPYIEIKGCIEVHSHNAAYIRNSPLFYIIGQHSARAAVARAEGPTVERLELEVHVGPRAAERLLKQISLIDEETPEGKAFLLKLREILETEDKNVPVSSESSSSRIISSSSSSMSSSRVTETANHMEPFKKFHKDQYMAQHGASKAVSSGSAASSFEHIQKQAKYLGNAVPPVVAVIARVVRVDHKSLGYQLAAFFDKPTARVQLIVSSIAENDNWKLCADGVLLSKHKVTTKVAWGAECQQYAVITKAEAGILGEFPAVRLEWEYERLPVIVTTYAKKLSKHIPMAALQAGVRFERATNSEKEIELTVALPTKRTLNVVVRAPEDILFRAQNYIYDYTTAQCSMMQDTITTFNNRRYKNEMPISCYQVLAQDCTPELKFVVLLKKDEESEENRLNVKLADIDVDLYALGTDAKVKVNEMEVPLSSLPYQHPSGSIQIREKADGLSLYAPSHGLQEVYFANGHWKIQVADWMKGQTCGLCGKADGEIGQEYTTPSGYLTKSSVSFAHSWVLPAESCRDASQCRMKLESVKSEKQAILNGQESKCYSVEPVLRCLLGCEPIRTIPVTIGYHCLSTDSNLNMFDGIYEKSVDLRETTDAHMACRCTEQCA
ncbi:Vitellogenin [Anabarilius grahami]|uniref:Vitellogenin n=2 Tax=Actinopteri TaxID=186623 RepID=A0A3N0Y3F7_ANAGA|nr:Vitellogenin [Anabarilius grahami]